MSTTMTRPRPWVFMNCDACGADSFFRFSYVTEDGEDRELYMCGHHGTRYWPLLVDEQAWFGEDYSALIGVTA